ncbi:uncharacterized protein LOC124630128 [Helicoverpa zea]|uniref:uncharacterized protein LOC124630128 n=1 Tax=Helicoverpa zea TaxID=7113 RepID=UPI001F56295E|nr:uncharacterized protein LOC124630128 [Helicoverpa zea]
MGTPNPDGVPLGSPDPTSEVGLGEARESEGVGDPWRAMLELQGRNMAQLIDAMKTPTTPSNAIRLPDFDPDSPDSNARSWSTTVDVCLSEKPLQGGPLIIALSKALKGSASVWLSQVSYAGMTWPDFKSIFLSRYDVSETIAATLINLHNSQPKEGESLASYASRHVTSLTSKWNSLSVEQIAVSTILAHVSKFDVRAHRLAFTTEIPTRHKLQQELSVLSHLKRKPQFSTDHVSSEPKRFKPSTIVCHYCGIAGHRAINCRKKADKTKHPGPAKSSLAKNVVCYRCGEAGHVAPRCPKTTGKRPGGSSEGAGSRASSGHSSTKRVEACEVRPSTGVLRHSESHEVV